MQRGARQRAYDAQPGGAFDLLLTDVVMPESSGVELARTLARDHTGLRVLYVSGYTGGHLAGDEALAVGHAFLAKPFTPDALLSSVRASLDGPPPAPAAADQDPGAA
ncbi:MAG: response regulator [Anaeromyxobacteraceae bacterium]